MNRPIVYQAASVCLSYPDETVLGLAPVVRRALDEAARPAAAMAIACCRSSGDRPGSVAQTAATTPA